jgi:uncharacterized protein YbaR (Trm112 family)
MATKTSGLELIACPYCSSKVRADRLAQHIAGVHSTGQAAQPQSQVLSMTPSKKQATAPTKKPRTKVFLNSRRGTRIEGPVMCEDCKMMRPAVWRYAESSHGVIQLCGVCKIKAFDRSFGKIDALDMTEDSRANRESGSLWFDK